MKLIRESRMVCGREEPISNDARDELVQLTAPIMYWLRKNGYCDASTVSITKDCVSVYDHALDIGFATTDD